jgi:hypothetical protein
MKPQNPEPGDSVTEEHPCCMCKSAGFDIEGSYCCGARYDYYRKRYMPFKGYLCDMHSSQLKNRRFLK